jgi:hypothetical protein
MSGKVLTNIVTNGLALYLDAANPSSYLGSGTTWNDISSNNRNISLIASPSYSNNNIIFNGSSQYATLTDSTIKTYTTITANLWMNIIAYTNTFETYFSYNAEETGLTQGWGIRRSGTDVFQYWGGNSNTGIKIYVDGILRGTSNSPSSTVAGYNITGVWRMITLVATGLSTWNTNNRFTLATRSDTLSIFTNYRLGLFNLYNRELSATEIVQNYNALKNRFGL